MYRKLEVGGKTWEYVIGSSYVKVKGLGVWPLEEVGKDRLDNRRCECCGETLGELYGDTRLTVVPDDIRKLIWREGL
jgi:hypothetical protein